MSDHPRRQTDILWILTEIAEKPRDGAAIYSRRLIHAAAKRGVKVCAFGLGERPDGPDGVTWHVYPRAKQGRGMLRSAFSRFPFMTSRLDIGLLRRNLRALLESSPPKVALVDHIKGAWAVKELERARHRGLVREIWYVSQNDEVAIWTEEVRTGGLSRDRILRLADLPRIRFAQQSLVRAANLVTAITEEDARSLESRGARRTVVLRPGVPEVGMDSGTPDLAERPRAVVIPGSVRWSLKLRNLVDLLEHAERILAPNDIDVVVAGSMSRETEQMLTRRFGWASILGEVQDINDAYARGRIAMISDIRGGGFKMKSLDVALAGLPMMSPHKAMAGLFFTDGVHYFGGDTFADICERVVGTIDNVPCLSNVARRARESILERFSEECTSGHLIAELKNIS